MAGARNAMPTVMIVAAALIENSDGPPEYRVIEGKWAPVIL
jgi:hypothetical protein